VSKLHIFIFIVLLSISLNAKKSLSSNAAKQKFSISAGLLTDFPVWMGASVETLLFDQFTIGLGYGFMPDMYSSIIGKVASDIADDPNYKPLFEAMLKKNSSFMLSLEYNFGGTSGWLIGAKGYRYNADGEASIVDILEIVTNQDYTQLKDILIARGLELNVYSKTSFYTGEIYAGYSWFLWKRFQIKTAIGAGKILKANISLSSDAPNFDNSATGAALYNESINEIKDVLYSYGYYPFITVNLRYVF